MDIQTQTIDRVTIPVTLPGGQVITIVIWFDPIANKAIKVKYEEA
jgi:hypothetical protein